MRRILSHASLVAAVALAHGGALFALRRIEPAPARPADLALAVRFESGPGDSPDEAPSVAGPVKALPVERAPTPATPDDASPRVPEHLATESVLSSTAPGPEGSLSAAGTAPDHAASVDATSGPAAPGPSASADPAAGQGGGPDIPPSPSGYLANPAPVYPYASRRAGEEGEVRLKVLVDSTGTPSRIELHRGSGHPRLDGAALAAVWKWSFRPARRAGRPVAGWVLVPLRFSLEGT
jgi:periplasmic protein TonB